MPPHPFLPTTLSQRLFTGFIVSLTTSGTYAFNPALSDAVLNSYARIGLHRTALTAEHFRDASDEANYLLVEWSNKQPLLWTSGTQTVSLVQGTATYVLDPQTVMILVAYIRTGSGENTVDRIVAPISTVEYSSIPNKSLQGVPTIFWFDRQIAPQVSIWAVPDQSYSLLLQTVRQVQDASLPGGVTSEVPYRALDAFAAGLAMRLARIHAPALYADRKADAAEAWNIFATADVENTPLYITPGLSAYFR